MKPFGLTESFNCFFCWVYLRDRGGREACQTVYTVEGFLSEGGERGGDEARLGGGSWRELERGSWRELGGGSWRELGGGSWVEADTLVQDQNMSVNTGSTAVGQS